MKFKLKARIEAFGIARTEVEALSLDLAIEEWRLKLKAKGWTVDNIAEDKPPNLSDTEIAAQAED